MNWYKTAQRLASTKNVDLKSQWASRYPIASSVVDGRDVQNRIPNTSSISASLSDYEVLPGIREIPMDDFHLTGRSYSVSECKRIESLSQEIHASKVITPLIVVIDADGPYILEGIHRAEALFLLKAQSFPALVVLDLEALEALEAPQNAQVTQPSQPKPMAA